MSSLTPQQIVDELDKHIVGQNQAKRAVAIALRNRWRRQQVQGSLRAEITPKNILMIGPTGVGKTEIARRLARLADAPFIKVEASKFTEVGYVGKDVDSIIRDLADVAIKQTRESAKSAVRERALDAAEERILDILIPPPRGEEGGKRIADQPESTARQAFRKKLREGQLDTREIEIDLSQSSPQVEIMGPAGMEEMTEQLRGLFGQMGQQKRQTRKLPVAEAFKLVHDEEAAKLVNEDDIKAQALAAAEQNGIVFIDEIDKVTSRSEGSNAGEVSRQGVQRDLLPLVEGTTVSTKYGPVKTTHILFIAAGAFHVSKPSDLIPELQGRSPIRVELQPLTQADLVRILGEPENSLCRQYEALLQTEGVKLRFAEDSIAEIARIASDANRMLEDIGARRLSTILERVLDELSFEAPEVGRHGDWVVEITAEYVRQRVESVLSNPDLSKYIL